MSFPENPRRRSGLNTRFHDGRVAAVAHLRMRTTRLGDLYHFLLGASWPALLLMIGSLFVVLNLLFALGYLLDPNGIENARPGSLTDRFFFSIQTMATIGYGRLSPVSLWTNVLVSLEALMGLVGLALVTGLVFAKFARPTARVLFSRYAVVARRDGVPSLMFRAANERQNRIVEAEIHAVLLRNELTVEGEWLRRLHDLTLVRSRNPMFILSWTAVHPITETSPLYGVTPDSLIDSSTEVIVTLMGLDETFSQTINARYVYEADKICWDACFVDLFRRLPDGRVEADYGNFHKIRPASGLESLAPEEQPSSSVQQPSQEFTAEQE